MCARVCTVVHVSVLACVIQNRIKTHSKKVIFLLVNIVLESQLGFHCVLQDTQEHFYCNEMCLCIFSPSFLLCLDSGISRL